MSSKCGRSGCRDGDGGCGGEMGEAVHDCVAAADALLAQAWSFVESLDDATYSRSCALASGGTIGKHLRHCVDHYAAAIAAMANPSGGPIDYDHRERDVPMESCRATAMATIARLRGELARGRDGDVNAAVTVRVMVSSEGRTSDLGSTVGRELAFAAHHALHHHAMMKFIADSFGCITPADFGKAPSTVHHENHVGSAVKV